MATPNIEFHEPSEKLAEHTELERVRLLYEDTLFHGTGRLAYGFESGDKSRPNGKLVDMLEAVAYEGIKPHADHVARLLLPQEKTVSLTQQRIYARCYAEMFGADHEGKTQLRYTFGEAGDWKKYYFEETANAMKTHRNIGYIPIALRHFFTRFTPHERKLVRDVEHHTQRWYVNKALVDGNHPMIFGINKNDIKTMELPYGLGFYEARTAEIISPEILRLLEVPLVKVNEVREAVAKLGLNIEVVPMEIGEVVSFLKGIEQCAGKSLLS